VNERAPIEELGGIVDVLRGDAIVGPFTDGGGQISRPAFELNELFPKSIVIVTAAAALTVLGGTPPPFALGTSIGMRSLISDSDLGLQSSQGDIVGIVSRDIATEAEAGSEAPKRSLFEQFDEWFTHASAVAAPILALLGGIAMAIGFARVPAEALRVFLLGF